MQIWFFLKTQSIGKIPQLISSSIVETAKKSRRMFSIDVPPEKLSSVSCWRNSHRTGFSAWMRLWLSASGKFLRIAIRKSGEIECCKKLEILSFFVVFTSIISDRVKNCSTKDFIDETKNVLLLKNMSFKHLICLVFSKTFSVITFCLFIGKFSSVEVIR